MGMQGSNRTYRGKLNPGVKATSKTGTGSASVVLLLCCESSVGFSEKGQAYLGFSGSSLCLYIPPEELTNQTQIAKDYGRNLFPAFIK